MNSILKDTFQGVLGVAFLAHAGLATFFPEKIENQVRSSYILVGEASSKRPQITLADYREADFTLPFVLDDSAGVVVFSK